MDIEYVDLLPILSGGNVFDAGESMSTTDSRGTWTVNNTSDLRFTQSHGFDKNANKYLRSGSGKINIFIEVRFPGEFSIGKYKLLLGRYNRYYSNMASWDIMARVDGTWVKIHSGTNTDSEATKEYEFTPVIADRIRIKCTGMHGSNSWGFDDFYLYEAIIKPINKSLILHDGEYKKRQEEILPSSNELIPLITSNTNSYVTFGGTTTPTSGEWYRMFDSNIADYWYIQATTGEITFTFPENKKVTRYFISHSNNPLNANRLPKTWTFEGSMNGIDYTVIDTRSIDDWTVLGYESYFSINSPNYYKSYKLNITTNSGNGTYTSIQSMSLIQDEGVYSPAQWLTISNSLPTKDQFLIDGMDSLSPLLDRRVETLEPISMDEKNELLSGEVGRLFGKTISLKRYVDIKNITCKGK